MSAHTPGPWEWLASGWTPCVGSLTGPGGEPVINHAPYEGSWFAGDEKKMNANIALIAAAPDLFEALEALLNRRMEVAKRLGVSAEDANGSDGRYARARAAIAKARGMA